MDALLVWTNQKSAPKVVTESALWDWRSLYEVNLPKVGRRFVLRLAGTLHIRC